MVLFSLLLLLLTVSLPVAILLLGVLILFTGFPKVNKKNLVPVCYIVARCNNLFTG